MTCKQFLQTWWRTLLIIVVPIVLVPVLFVPSDVMRIEASRCLYVMLLMAIFWCAEVVAIPITACLPILLFPLMGVLKASDVCDLYMTATVMMFLGGLVVALAVEKCGLHRRMALSILHIVGTKPLWLMLGFIIPTGILSMWMSNTATTSMMLPICEAVIESLYRSHNKSRNRTSRQIAEEGTTFNLELNSDVHSDDKYSKGQLKTKFDIEDEIQEIDDELTMKENVDKFAKGMTLAICYAANTGGTATLIGTPPNTIMKGQADELWTFYGYEESSVTFMSWMVVGMPVAILCMVIVWLWLSLMFNGIRSLCPCGNRKSEDHSVISAVIEKEYKTLGRITFAQITVGLMFVLMVFLWFFRSPRFMTGWANNPFFKSGYTHDSVVSIGISLLLCIIPAKLPSRNPTAPGWREVERLMDWQTIHNKMPWGAFFLIGGGFSLAKASTESGLSAWIASGLGILVSLPGWAMVVVLCIITAFLTEITSNSATTTILLPIMASLADTMGCNPLYLMIPVTLSASFAFMLPVATTPNVIAFSFGRIKIIDMIKAGFLLNFLCVGVVTLAINTWGHAFFQLDKAPWANNQTVTVAY